MLTATSH